MTSLLSGFNKLDESSKASLLDYLDFLLKKQDPAAEDVKPAGKRGRPRKVQVEVTEAEVAADPKSKATRSRKKAESIKVETAIEPKRGRGRPKKAVEVAIESPVKGKRGRPKKEAAVADIVAEQPKKGRGRPKKATIIEEAPIAVAAEPKKGRGRPRKVVVVEEPIVIEPVEDVAASQTDEPAVDA